MMVQGVSWEPVSSSLASGAVAQATGQPVYQERVPAVGNVSTPAIASARRHNGVALPGFFSAAAAAAASEAAQYQMVTQDDASTKQEICTTLRSLGTSPSICPKPAPFGLGAAMPMLATGEPWMHGHAAEQLAVNNMMLQNALSQQYAGRNCAAEAQMKQILGAAAVANAAGSHFLSQYNMMLGLSNAAALGAPAIALSTPDGLAHMGDLLGDRSAVSSNTTKTSSPVADEIGGEGHITTFPRRKAGQDVRTNSAPVLLNKASIESLFHLSLQGAAAQLGLSRTAMKSACRKLGIKKWPHRLRTTPGRKSDKGRGERGQKLEQGPPRSAIDSAHESGDSDTEDEDRESGEQGTTGRGGCSVADLIN